MKIKGAALVVFYEVSALFYWDLIAPTDKLKFSKSGQGLKFINLFVIFSIFRYYFIILIRSAAEKNHQTFT